MENDLSAMLQAVMADPDQMAGITQLARQLMGEAQDEKISPTEEIPAQAGDARLISAMGRALASGGGQSRSTALLAAMRPYIKPEKRGRLDRAMELAQMARLAEAVMREYGEGE